MSTQMENACLRCQEPIISWMHRCASNVMVIHPTLWRDSWRNTNPLDRLTVVEEMKTDSRAPDIEARVAQANEQYLHEPLTFRV